MVARERMPVEREDVRARGVGRASRGATVGACERMSVGHNTCSAAALGGHLEVLQWARANGCPWDATTCLHAKVGGNIELLNWAIANGCPTHPAVLP